MSETGYDRTWLERLHERIGVWLYWRAGKAGRIDQFDWCCPICNCCAGCDCCFPAGACHGGGPTE